MPTPRRRLDALLVERGLASSRGKARALILAGRVEVEGRRQDKPGTQVAPECRVVVRSPGRVFASRGGHKLDGALKAFRLDVRGRTVLDIGASTGGFTDVLLRGGAACIVAVDVGYGQLDWTLRRDERVRVLERTNARHLSPEDLPDELPGAPDMAVVDVSFISLEKVLPAVVSCLAPPADVVALVKPQFEAGPRRVGKGGVVRDPTVHREVLLGLLEWAAASGLGLEGLVPSPLAGASGNLEFFLWLRPGAGRLGGEEARAEVDAATGAG